MITNKICPFCRITMRKSIIFGSKECKIHCFRCRNYFREIDGVFFFNINGADIIIDDSSMIINIGDNSYKIEEKFNVYGDFKKVIDKLQTVLIFQ